MHGYKDAAVTPVGLLSSHLTDLLRMLDRVTLKDHITSESLLIKYNLPSVNQLAAEIKLTEAWKTQNINNYPFKLEANNPNRCDGDRIVRASTTKSGKIYLNPKLLV